MSGTQENRRHVVKSTPYHRDWEMPSSSDRIQRFKIYVHRSAMTSSIPSTARMRFVFDNLYRPLSYSTYNASSSVMPRSAADVFPAERSPTYKGIERTFPQDCRRRLQDLPGIADRPVVAMLSRWVVSDPRSYVQVSFPAVVLVLPWLTLSCPQSHWK